MSSSIDALIAAKREARREAALRRARARVEAPDAPQLLCARFLSDIPVPADAAVAGYWPVATEMDVRPLLGRLAESGIATALPVVPGPGRPLRFHLWRPGEALEPGAFNVPAPPASAPETVPTLVIVPMLAFDRQGRRLGYGAGFYDRTLAELRRAGSVLAVGVAYAGQEMERVPTDDHDAPLDWIVTERASWRIGT